MNRPQMPFDSRCEATFMDDTGWHLTRCSRQGRYEEQGKHWCKQHLPSIKATKAEERSRQWEAKFENRENLHRRAACFPGLVAALEAALFQMEIYPDHTYYAFGHDGRSKRHWCDLCDRIDDARAALAKAKEVK